MKNFELKLRGVQKALVSQEIDGWLLYDSHRSNHLAHLFLEIPKSQMVTRRFFYWIPQKGEPIKIVPLIEPHTLDHLPGIKWYYRGWQELERLLFSLSTEQMQIAMEYSPFNALPSVSNVDAGMFELIRKTGAEIVSSANLLQEFIAVLSQDQVESHFRSAQILEKIVDATWMFIENALELDTHLYEYHVQQFMMNLMKENNCITSDLPICAVNANAADPHYTPKEGASQVIKHGDMVLIDLWCKLDKPNSVYADIARVALLNSKPSQILQQVFDIVKEARDVGIQFIKDHYERGRHLEGWQVDSVCREVITKAGFGEFFIHRTGHNIGEEVHGYGANLDNFETHDYRLLLPGTCCSIEPGIYLPKQFGVRLESNVYLDPNGTIVVTGGVQEYIRCLQ